MGKRDFDIVVVGGGLAGHRAALAAASTGAKVALLEKQNEIGGSTALSGGSFAFAGTETQKDRQIEDSDELLRKDLLDAGRGDAVQELVDVFVSNQLQEYDYLRSLGIVFTHVQASAGHSVPRSHRSDPLRVIKRLHAEMLKERSVHFMPSTAATRLIAAKDGSRIEALTVSCGAATETGLPPSSGPG